MFFKNEKEQSPGSLLWFRLPHGELSNVLPTPHRPGDWARSQAALARRAMIASRVSSLAAESETNAATARCRTSGRVIVPVSYVAEVMPFRVPPVPVLCATTVPAGNSPLRRFAPGLDSVISFNNKV